jgi:hypothetical protein
MLLVMHSYWLAKFMHNLDLFSRDIHDFADVALD